MKTLFLIIIAVVIITGAITTWCAVLQNIITQGVESAIRSTIKPEYLTSKP